MKAKIIVIDTSNNNNKNSKRRWLVIPSSALIKAQSQLVSLTRKAISIQSKPTEESFPELPDLVIWVRAVIAFLYGCYVGMYYSHIANGGAIFFQALNLLTFVPYTYCKWYLGTPAGVFDMSILFGGTPQALCLFLLVWIYFFTAAHSQDEAALSALLVVVTTNDTAAGGDEAAASAAAGVSSEF